MTKARIVRKALLSTVIAAMLWAAFALVPPALPSVMPAAALLLFAVGIVAGVFGLYFLYAVFRFIAAFFGVRAS
ncbi:hypothetical protein [Methanoculleus oceani]|uniref:Uncharacterized protein n=1 Tax=Methanoculleus oceani TaxID=2184756 RepID=A0ABD4TDX5_9EURY|nr:hypothetical protein [Methanoculleus sp. CWC-02]MCM2465079.1 hypothetical protein [Methanoculleus sp. CWC-02]